MSTAEPMATWERVSIYTRDRAALTPKQRRRVIHKNGRLERIQLQERIERHLAKL